MSVNVRPTGDRAVDEFQREVAQEFANVARGISELPQSPLDRAVILENLDLTTTPQTFPTKLGKVHQGCIVIHKGGNIDVWESGEKSPGKITLVSDAPARVTVMVF